MLVVRTGVSRGRDEPFWRRMAEMDIPTSLESRLTIFRERGHAYQDQDELFRVDSWVQVMLGQGLVPRAFHPFGRMIPDGDLEQSLSALSENIRAASERLPSHEAFLSGFLQA
jgi:tryptophan halogenase